MRMLNQSTADDHPFVHILPEAPRDAHDPLPVMRREMKLLLIELNLLRVEVERLRAMDEEARKTKDFLSRSVDRVMESRDRWKREAEYLSALIAQVPPWSLFWWRCRDAFKAWWAALSGSLHPASKH
jgi:hypothetical protein